MIDGNKSDCNGEIIERIRRIEGDQRINDDEVDIESSTYNNEEIPRKCGGRGISLRMSRKLPEREVGSHGEVLADNVGIVIRVCIDAELNALRLTRVDESLDKVRIGVLSNVRLT